MQTKRELSRENRAALQTVEDAYFKMKDIDARAEAVGLEWSRRLNRFVPIKARPARRVTA
jgi:hypothetical protein